MKGKDRGSRKRGVSNDQVAVIVTQDRISTLDLSVTIFGRIGKVDIENAIDKCIKKAQPYYVAMLITAIKGLLKTVKWSFTL